MSLNIPLVSSVPRYLRERILYFVEGLASPLKLTSKIHHFCRLRVSQLNLSYRSIVLVWGGYKALQKGGKDVPTPSIHNSCKHAS